MRVISISTKFDKYVKTNVQINEVNPTVLKIKILPPLKSVDVDYYIIQYVDKMNRRYESKKLYIDSDDYIVDKLTKPLLQSTELNVIVGGYCNSEDNALYKSAKVVLLFYDKNMQYTVKGVDTSSKHNCVNKPQSRPPIPSDKPSIDLEEVFKQHIKDKSFTYTQSVADKEWHIVHDLQKYPSVSVVDSAGNIVIGDVEYISISKIIVRFSGAFSGKAYLN